ncbi:MAG: CrcB family protein [Rhodococcus sp. (in: high G+C Gram-positive bacteria)]
MTPPRLSESATVALGGAIGAVTRFEIWQWRDTPRWLLINTFGINVVGCLLLGAALGYLSGRPAPLLRAGVMGLACGFTTFGFYALQGVTHAGAWNSVAYIVVTPVVAVAALAVGALTTRPTERVR